MASFRIQNDELRLISFLSAATRIEAIDCIYNPKRNETIFILKEEDKSKLKNLDRYTRKRIRELLKKRVTFIVYSDNLTDFVANTVFPAKIHAIEILEKHNKKNVIIEVLPGEKGRVIGKKGRTINRSRFLLERYFEVKSVRIRTVSKLPFNTSESEIKLPYSSLNSGKSKIIEKVSP